MIHCFFVTDIHGSISRFNKLLSAIKSDKPDVVFIGGDILPGNRFDYAHVDFLQDWLIPRFIDLRRVLERQYPRIFIILGNDDFRSSEGMMLEADAQGVWSYIHNRKKFMGDYTVYGLSYVPPTPFALKDWERYDVSQFVDPGSTHPWEGYHTTPAPGNLRYKTIKKYLETLTNDDDLSRSIFLFHSPPHNTHLDRAALDGITVDSVPMDRHVGSIAIRKFIRNRMPFLTLHGHIHESFRLTGVWKEEIGPTVCINGANETQQLVLTEFSLPNAKDAMRRIL